MEWPHGSIRRWQLGVLVLALCASVHGVQAQSPAGRPVRPAQRFAVDADHHAWVRNQPGRLGFVPLHQRIESTAKTAEASESEASGVIPASAEMTLEQAWDAAYGDPVAAGIDPSWDASMAAGAPVSGCGDPLCTECPGVSSVPCGCGTPDCGGACMASRWWVSGQYLFWFAQGADAPALLTTSPAGTPRESAGELGQASTSILFGGEDLHGGSQSGYELALGMWLDPMSGRALQLRYLSVGPEESNFSTSSDQIPILARPIFDIQAGEPASLLIGFPNFVDGQVQIATESQFRLADGMADWPLCFPCDAQVRWQLGYRFSRLTDDLAIQQATIARSSDTGLAPGTTIRLRDDFQAKNDFNGALLGISAMRQGGCLALEARVRIGVGSTQSSTLITGQTVTTAPGDDPQTTSVGLLAQSTNDGLFEENRFSVMPEFGLQLYYDAPCNVRFTLGYTFLYWSQVMRAAEQIDLDVNPSLFPPSQLDGAPRPEFEFRFTDYWAQGLNVGAEYRW